jgi:hypothetical protein
MDQEGDCGYQNWEEAGKIPYSFQRENGFADNSPISYF